MLLGLPTVQSKVVPAAAMPPGSFSLSILAVGLLYRTCTVLKCGAQPFLRRRSKKYTKLESEEPEKRRQEQHSTDCTVQCAVQAGGRAGRAR